MAVQFVLSSFLFIILFVIVVASGRGRWLSGRQRYRSPTWCHC
jgi:hypothetical protein